MEYIYKNAFLKIVLKYQLEYRIRAHSMPLDGGIVQKCVKKIYILYNSKISRRRNRSSRRRTSTCLFLCPAGNCSSVGLNLSFTKTGTSEYVKNDVVKWNELRTNFRLTIFEECKFRFVTCFDSTRYGCVFLIRVQNMSDTS